MFVAYAPLEENLTAAVGVTIPTFEGASPTLSTTTSLITIIFFMLIGGAAFYRYVMAGIYRLEASENGVRKSNEAFKGATFGVLGVFLMFLIFFTFNRDILLSDVGLGALRSGGVARSGSAVLTGNRNIATRSGEPATCGSKEEVIMKISSQSGICGGTACTFISGCAYSQYASIIKSEAQSAGIDPKVVAVIMCKESQAKPNAQGRNPNGTYDCGLMQVNQATPCDANSLDPQQNIRRGVALIKQKTSAVNQSYSGIPQRLGVFASYNCCANGTTPHAPSADCTTSSGFPFSIPKWACPLNPGEGQYNMCSVKNYVCGIDACVSQIQL